MAKDGLIIGIGMKPKDKPSAIREEDMPEEEPGMETTEEFKEIDGVVNSIKQEFLQGNIDKMSAIHEIISSLQQLMPTNNMGRKEKDTNFMQMGKRMIGRKGEPPNQSLNENYAPEEE